MLESLGMEAGVLRTAHPRTLGCFLSFFKALSRATAEHFLTLPLARSPPQRRGKYRVCTFHERSRNGCVFTSGMGMGGLITPPFTLRFFCWLWYFLFGCASFLALPFLLEIQQLSTLTYWWHTGSNSGLLLLKLSRCFQRHSPLPARVLLPVSSFSMAMQ